MLRDICSKDGPTAVVYDCLSACISPAVERPSTFVELGRREWGQDARTVSV